jgi:hypothetical protein
MGDAIIDDAEEGWMLADGRGDQPFDARVLGGGLSYKVRDVAVPVAAGSEKEREADNASGAPVDATREGCGDAGLRKFHVSRLDDLVGCVLDVSRHELLEGLV